MFTGLVQGLGRMLSVENRGKETRFRIEPQFAMENIVLGESIAVNGVCLTVETTQSGWFTAYASAETIGLTNLGEMRVGSTANLERALALGDRLGGHMVSGHVDCLASVESITPVGESRCYRIVFPKEFGTQVVGKGSVALDGVSLTINACGSTFLEVNIIPATLKETTIGRWTPGYKVNLETDIIGKYVQRMLGAWQGTENGSASSETPDQGMSMDFLRKHGF